MVVRDEIPEKTMEETAALAALVNIAEDTEASVKNRIVAAEVVLRHEYSRGFMDD